MADYSDTFTGTNGQTLPTYSANWATPTGWTALQISVNRAVCPSAGDYCNYWTQAVTAKQYSRVTVDSDGGGGGVAFHIQTNGDCIYVYWDSGGTAYVSKKVSGTSTDYDSGKTVGSGVALELVDDASVSGRFYLKSNGTTIATYNESLITSGALQGGKPGVYGYTATLDDWAGGDVAAAGAVLTVEQASYAFTPQSVATKPAFQQTSDQASYSFTPQNVTTSRTTASLMAAAQASYAFTPQNITTVKSATYFTTAAQASYAFTPQDITTTWGASNLFEWTRVTGNEGYRVEWGQTSGGPYPNTANTATNVEAYNIVLPAFTTWYARVAALVGGVPQDYSTERVFTSGIPDFDPEAASYVFTPQNVVTNVGFGQPNTQASYSFTPQNITTKPAFGQTSDQASYAFTPQNIATSLIRSFITTADVGSYSFSPQDTTTRQSVTVEPVDQASYAFSPQDIATNTIKAYVMAADQAGYTLTPQNVLTVAFLSRILAIGYALYSFTPYGVAIPGEVTPGNAVRRRNNRALAARLWRNKQELARKLFGV